MSSRRDVFVFPAYRLRRWLGPKRHICPDCGKSFDCLDPKDCEGSIYLQHSEYSGLCSEWLEDEVESPPAHGRRARTLVFDKTPYEVTWNMLKWAE